MVASSLKALRIIVLGAIGVFAALGGLHLYVDHQLLHVLVSIEAARQKQIQPEGK